MPDDTKLIQTHVAKECHDKLRVVAFRAGGISLSELLRVATADFLDRFEEKHGKISQEDKVDLT